MKEPAYYEHQLCDLTGKVVANLSIIHVDTAPTDIGGFKFGDDDLTDFSRMEEIKMKDDDEMADAAIEKAARAFLRQAFPTALDNIRSNLERPGIVHRGEFSPLSLRGKSCGILASDEYVLTLKKVETTKKDAD